MKLLVPVILQLIGVVAVIAEFIVPTAGILAVLSLGIFGYSLYYVFAHVSFGAGAWFAAADLIVVPVLVVTGFKGIAKSKMTLHNSLSNKDGVVSQPAEWAALAGRSGTALTALHPAGSALIDGMKYDVVSRGDFINKGATVTVIAIDGNRIVVTKKE
jgi:membrane-bound ClpP family serine protease